MDIDGPGEVERARNAELEVRLAGITTPVAAFNFDIVYDQRLVELEAPEAALDLLNTDGRQFQCDLPPASGDVDPDPEVGRARLVCFSFGGEEASAPETPLTVARVTVRGVSAGTATLRLENVAFFAPDASPIDVSSLAATITVEGG